MIRTLLAHIKTQFTYLKPLQALQHPSFKEMIDVAARATNGVKIDNLRNTREGILREFKRNVTSLSKRLNVSAFFPSSGISS